MTAIFHKISISNNIEFSKFPEIPTENEEIPAGNFWNAGFPGIPELEFLVALGHVS